MNTFLAFSSIQELFGLFVLSFVLGAFIGMQKDVLEAGFFSKLKKEQVQNDFAGMRSFGLISLFGAMMQYMDQLFGMNLVFTILGFICVGLFVNIDYIYQVFQKQRHSPATELSTLILYFLGVLVFIDSIKIAIILCIALAIILASKQKIHTLLTNISQAEIYTTLKFAAIAFVILPLLPNERFSFLTFFQSLGFSFADSIHHPIWEMLFFNPYTLWLFVVVMSGISYIGYILTRIYGDKSGILLSSLMGGLISSTAVTASMSEASKKNPQNSSLYTTGTLLASGVMFVRVIAIAGFLYPRLIASIIIPASVMFFVLMGMMFYFYLMSRKQIHSDIHLEEKVESPFRLTPALKFAAFILGIKFISALGLIYKDIWGEGLFYYTLGIISGLADVDAITQTMSLEAKTGALALSTAGITILIAVMSNNIVKGSLAYRFGETSFGRKVLLSFIASMLSGVVAIFFIG